jgi:nucleotide sugar dehydrogenase
MSRRFSVIGAGRLGLCVGLVAAKCGYDVMLMDIDEDRVTAINARKLRSPEPGVDELLCKVTGLTATTSVEDALAHAEWVYILVPTPDGPNGYDHSILEGVFQDIKGAGYRGQVVIGCTVLPGTTSDFSVYAEADYNPLFVRQGRILYDLMHPRLVLIGESHLGRGNRIEGLHRAMFWAGGGGDTVEQEAKWRLFRVSPLEAEIAKLSLNCFLTMKIAFANVVSDIAYRSGGECNPALILECVGSDPRIGTDCLVGGYGYGGPCLPRDNRALGIYGEYVGVDPCMFVATDLANRRHTRTMAARLMEEGRENYIFDSVSYKADVPYIEGSQQLQVAKVLREAGARVTINERPEVIKQVRERYGNLFEYTEREK